MFELDNPMGELGLDNCRVGKHKTVADKAIANQGFFFEDFSPGGFGSVPGWIKRRRMWIGSGL